MEQEKIGKFIKKLRIEHNMTQNELASKLGVTYQAVSKWENGKNIPDITLLKQISDLFDVEINDILNGEVIQKKDKTKKYKKIYNNVIFIAGIVLLILLIILLILNNKSHFEFKKLSTTCNNFEITGSIAYNEKKSSIYISDIKYCGKEDNTVYKKIECVLYEEEDNRKENISSCNTKNDISLDDYLHSLNINVDDYTSICKNFSHSNLYLEIKAFNNSNEAKTYIVPIVFENNCDN